MTQTGTAISDRTLLARQSARLAAGARTAITAEVLMDWAEGAYPAYFPGHKIAMAPPLADDE
jgi:hypothetical protein